MLSVPLIWHDQTVGVLNVQTEQPRDVHAATTSTSCGARRGPAGRHRREGPPAVARPRRASRRSRRSTRPAASSSPSSPTSCGRRSRSSAPTPTCWPTSRRCAAASRATSSRRADARGLASRDPRAGRAAGPARRLDPGLRPGRARGPGLGHARSISAALVDEVVALAAAAARPPHRARSSPSIRLHGPRRPAAAPPDPGAPRRERGQVRPAATPRSRIDWALARGRRPARRQRRGPGHPGGVARADLRAVRPARHAHRARLRASACMPPNDSANPWAPACGASRPVPHGARFVVALPGRGRRSDP